MEQTAELRVQLLGAFRMEYGGHTLSLRSGSTTKAAQILQLLVARYPLTALPQELVDALFSDPDILSPSNNLKVSVSQLRRQLRELNIPGAPFVTYSSRGYCWTPELPPRTDVAAFLEKAKAAESAPAAEKLSRCLAACESYTGRFLPMLRGTGWVDEFASEVEERYAQCVRGAAAVYMAAGEYDSCQQLGKRAMERAPREEWQLMRVRCCMEQGLWDEAKAIYMETVEMLARKNDSQPGTELMREFRTVTEHLKDSVTSLPELLEDVREAAPESGAYCCAFPGFIDTCRVVVRTMERQGSSCYLCLVSLVNISGEPLTQSPRIEEGEDCLREVLQHSLRRSDVFTQYSAGQFLILMQGINQSALGIVQGRITDRFRQCGVRGARLQFEFHTAKLDTVEHFGKVLQWEPANQP